MIIVARTTEIFETNIDWSVTSVLSGLATGGKWDFAEFGGYVIGTNGRIMVKRGPSTGEWTSFSASSTIPLFGTICNFKGQAVVGNVKGDWYDCSSNSILWSDIGSIDFTVAIDHTAGYRHIPWSGDVVCVRRLGDGVAVYGDNGLGLLAPVSEPIVTFGFKEVLDIGIPGEGAVGGDTHTHVFVDREGWLWKISEGSAPERLGYQEFMNEMTLADIDISYNPDDKEFYISDGTTGFILTPYGLCETFQLVESVVAMDGSLVGTYSSGSDTAFRVVSDTIDFGIRGFKSLGVVELGVDTGEVDQDVDVALYHRSSKKAAFGQTSYIHTNPEGWTYPNITAHEFRLCVQADSYLGIKLDYINARVKVVDRRSIRGVYAMQKYAEGQKG